MISSASGLITVLILALVSLLGVLMTAVRLPGTWVMVVAAAATGWWTGWKSIGLGMTLLLVAAAVVGEIVELVASMVTAKKAGASRPAAWGGLIGGFVGMIFLSIPVPILGTIVGAIVGCFAGSAIAEFAVRRKVAQGTKVGVFAAMGFVLGTATKTAVAFAMAGVLLTSAACPKTASRPPHSTQSAPVPITR